MFLCRKPIRTTRLVRFCSTTRTFDQIPSAKGLPLVGTLLSLIAAGGGTKLHEYVAKRHRELGAIFKEKLGPTELIFLNDIDEIRKVFANEGKYPKHVLPESWLLYNKAKNFQRGLYFMDDEEWFRYRKILNNVMLLEDFNERAARNEPILEKCYEMWLCNSQNEQIVDLETQLYNLSLIFMTSFILGTPFHANSDVFMPNISKLTPFVKEIFEWSVKLSVIPANLAMYLNLRPWTGFVNTIDNCVKVSSDLFDDMLRYDSDSILGFLQEKEVPRDVIRRIIIDFFIAAGDTTATATLWILYLLGRHKDIQDRLYLEFKRNERYWEIPLLRNTVRESMRLYPVAPFITRYLPQTTEIASYLIDPKYLISMSMFNCSRNETYFPDGNSFKPDRWERLQNGKYAEVVNAYATLPYAAGARSCIGKKLAQAQLCCTIYKLLSLYELDVPTAVDVKLNLITVPSEPIILKLYKRK